ncbi:unnamed protein product [Nezara viridula]|uniref:Neuropeptide n=1 Tax=Nezara viridula TaxID=85310 RepID=A0A9P0H202_NEZVI|nr:unnamed protein product [Nezara viridula]
MKVFESVLLLLLLAICAQDLGYRESSKKSRNISERSRSGAEVIPIQRGRRVRLGSERRTAYHEVPFMSGNFTIWKHRLFVVQAILCIILQPLVLRAKVHDVNGRPEWRLKKRQTAIRTSSLEGPIRQAGFRSKRSVGFPGVPQGTAVGPYLSHLLYLSLSRWL